MSTTFVMPSPVHHLTLSNDRSWKSNHAHDVPEARPQGKKLELPSFRETFGDLLQTSSMSEHSRISAVQNTSPRDVGPPAPLMSTSTQPNKRRRLGTEEPLDWRTAQAPRYHQSPERLYTRAASPSLSHRAGPIVVDSRTGAGHAGGFTHHHPPRSAPSDMSDEISNQHPPHHYSRGPISDRNAPAQPPPPPHPGLRTHEAEAYARPHHAVSYHAEAPPTDARSGYAAQGYAYSMAPGSGTYETTAAGAGAQYGRATFAADNYGPQYGQGVTRYMEHGYLGANGNNKPRKRRGNLPKETTDKLRAWFMDHIQHPYPTEDEKQELMQQTKLQMNQISNWFINARRRQLPAANGSQSEHDAGSSRHSDTSPGSIKRETDEYGYDKHGGGGGGGQSLSDGESRKRGRHERI